MISSPSNPKLRYVQHLRRRAYRAREDRLLLEGVRLTESALEAGHQPAFALLSPDLDRSQRGASLRAVLVATDTPVFDVDPALLRRAAETQHPQGVLAVFPIPRLALPESPNLMLLLDGLRDPGNLGSALRTADAAGLDAVFLTPGTVDWTNPKVLRAAMGAHSHIPVRHLSWPELDAALAEMDPRPALWLADATAEQAHSSVDWRKPSLLIIGGEADGASAEAHARSTGRLRIPMPGQAESLNATGAAAVILFEARRQRA